MQVQKDVHQWLWCFLSGVWECALTFYGFHAYEKIFVSSTSLSNVGCWTSHISFICGCLKKMRSPKSYGCEQAWDVLNVRMERLYEVIHPNAWMSNFFQMLLDQLCSSMPFLLVPRGYHLAAGVKTEVSINVSKTLLSFVDVDRDLVLVRWALDQISFALSHIEFSGQFTGIRNPSCERRTQPSVLQWRDREQTGWHRREAAGSKLGERSHLLNFTMSYRDNYCYQFTE